LCSTLPSKAMLLLSVAQDVKKILSSATCKIDATCPLAAERSLLVVFPNLLILAALPK